MAITRADKYTQINKKQEYFSDFLDNFDRHPITNSLVRVTNENSITQSLKNLFYTDLGERVFEPRVGSDIRAALFEPNDIVTANRIIDSINYTVKSKEPRVNLLNVVATPDPQNYGFVVDVVYSVINNPTPVAFQFFLKRVR